MTEKNKKIIFAVVAVIVVVFIAVGGIMAYRSNNNKASVNYDNFAKCLAEKNVVMYGAEWCSHCKAQKEAFGSSFQYIKYVECTTNESVCKAKNILGFPTWISDKGELFEGEQSMAKLAEISGCQLPVSN
jgi:glutaredoxin